MAVNLGGNAQIGRDVGRWRTQIWRSRISSAVSVKDKAYGDALVASEALSTSCQPTLPSQFRLERTRLLRSTSVTRQFVEPIRYDRS